MKTIATIIGIALASAAFAATAYPENLRRTGGGSPCCVVIP